MKAPRKQPRLARRICKGFAVLAMLGLFGFGALLGALWLERRTELTLPPPTGSFAVGRAIYDWTDDARLDTLGPVPGTKRELLVWIWYPSAAEQSVAMDDYVPAQIRAAAGPKGGRSEEHTSELQSLAYLVCRLLLEKKKKTKNRISVVIVK